MDASTIGKRLKAMRGNTSPAVVSKDLGISVSALFMYERGERIPRDEIKERIAAYYQQSVQSIFFG